MIISSRNRAIMITIAVGLLAAMLSAIAGHVRGTPGSDFTWLYRGALLLLDGQNPYRDSRLAFTNPYPNDSPLFYPLAAVMLAVPFTTLPLWGAAALFTGLGAGALSYAVLFNRSYLWPVLISSPMVVAVASAQWAPLMMAVALLPALQGIALLKPNLGISSLLYGGSWRTFLIAGVVVGAPWLYAPSWGWDWLSNVLSLHDHWAPVLFLPIGPLLVLSVPAWRRPAGRLLIALSVLPQKLWWYDQAALWLVCETQRQALVLSIFSWGLFLASRGGGVSSTLCSVALFFPALALLLHAQWVDRKDEQRGRHPERRCKPSGAASAANEPLHQRAERSR